jgi:hypothetical protein
VQGTVAMSNQKEGNKARRLEEDPRHKHSESYPERAGTQIQARIPATNLTTQKTSITIAKNCKDSSATLTVLGSSNSRNIQTSLNFRKYRPRKDTRM